MKLVEGEVDLSKWEDCFFEIKELCFEKLIKNKCQEVLQDCAKSKGFVSSWVDVNDNEFVFTVGIDFDGSKGTYYEVPLFELIDDSVVSGVISEYNEESKGKTKKDLISELRNLADKLEAEKSLFHGVE